MRSSAELRRAWNDFFAARQHTLVPSASLIPTHPSAPMFTNSGMMQFVPYFLGEETPPFNPPRAASIQRCVRAGGKHNDLDAIGRSLRHLSFFEMLGNFSFGDYFKPEAIAWAWEFVTEVLGLDPGRMWVTIHVSDDAAEEIWADAVGFPRDRIQRLDKDNFWEMGDTGPCGPSSEIFWDFGPDLGPDGGPANPAAENRYVEMWNLVFPQYLRDAEGNLGDLPRKCIDTGAGLERILGVLNDSHSLYAADTLTSLIEEAQSVTGHRLGESELGDIALRLMADHARTMTFLVADGVIPSNEDRGYVLRRIVRRAIRFAYLLDVERPVLEPMIDRTVQLMGEAYPEIQTQRDFVVEILAREEASFRRTLASGSQILDNQLEALPKGGTLDGNVAFQLHDTYGFPFEVTQEIADLRGYKVDVSGFETAMDQQRERARSARKGGGVATGEEVDEHQRILSEHGPTEFTGREEYESQATIIGIVGDGLFLDRTPYYAESGGQIGDIGTITTPTGTVEVSDTTYALPGLNRHAFRVVEGTVEVGQEATASIDRARRDAIRRNHTGTHILHWALREVLGKHVKQQGSLVAPDRLRFDFSHFEPVSAEDLRAIEDLANQEILANDPVRHFETTMDQARELGAIAFFGDKYGDIVRVLEAGTHSVELCGGTHVRRLGDIGPLKVVSEASIGANLRRIEAITGTGPIERLREEEALIERAAEVLGTTPVELPNAAEKLRAENKALAAELRLLRQQAAGSRAGELAQGASDGVVIARVDGTSRDELRDLAVAVRDQNGVEVVVIGGALEGGGVALVAAVTKDSGRNAGQLIADAAKTVGGGAGKNAELAVAGGRDPSGLDKALDQARQAADSAGS
ncbi:MAG TPA: alanine--tRNA ligase [Acidimicrobiales bacterium]